MKVEDGIVNGENGLVFVETDEESSRPSSTLEFEVNNRRRQSLYQEILQNYNELRIRCKNLKEAKEKILRYWFEVKLLMFFLLYACLF